MRGKTGKNRDRLIVGISGASGVAIGIRILEALTELSVESHLVVSKAGDMTIGLETKLTPKLVAQKADYHYAIADIAAPIASGSFRGDGMIVAPCSVRSWSEIATGITSNLLTRAADVTLKERRPLILVVREAPLHLGHLRALTQLAEMGAIVVPPVPAFYAAPHSLGDMVDQITGRTLDLLGYDWPKVRRWGEDLSKGRRKGRARGPAIRGA
jgi:4-hydroxy-3-polyprenylbenzoate decarboxylase